VQVVPFFPEYPEMPVGYALAKGEKAITESAIRSVNHKNKQRVFAGEFPE
jgi:hypothetical protein